MSKDEKELLDDFRQMTPENRVHFLSLAHATRSAQVNALKAYNKKTAREIRLNKATKKTRATMAARA